MVIFKKYVSTVRNAHITVVMLSSGSFGYKDGILANGETVAPCNYAFSGGSGTFSLCRCPCSFFTKNFLLRG